MEVLAYAARDDGDARGVAGVVLGPRTPLGWVQPPAAQVLLQPHDEIEIKRRNESDSGERGHALAAATAPRGVLQHADAPCDAPVSNSPEAPAAPEEERKGQQ